MSGYRHCITETAADRQRQFENALLELMKTMEYSGISIQEICDRVGLSRKSFYHYFSGKDACLNALIDHNILDFTELLIQGQMLERFFSYWAERGALLDALRSNGKSDLLMERAVQCAIREYGVRNYFHEEGGSFDRTVFFISGLFGAMLSWHLGGRQKTPAQMAATLADFLL